MVAFGGGISEEVVVLVVDSSAILLVFLEGTAGRSSSVGEAGAVERTCSGAKEAWG